MATFPTERYGGRIFEWDEKHYFAIADEAGRVGLMDTAGAWVLEPAWDAITTVALGQAVVSLNGTYQVVSLDSGEVLFTWPYTICEIHAEGYVVETDHYRYCLRCTPSPGDYQGYLYCYDKQQQELAHQVKLVGRVTYADGTKQEFTDPQQYLRTIREELPYLPTS